jgi:hypothetical protein
VSDTASIELELFRELIHELVRADIISDDMIDSVRERFDAQARIHEGTETGEKFEQLAHMATVLPFEAAAPSPAEFHAEQRRARMRVVSDGGKAQD